MPELPLQLLNSLEAEPHFNRGAFIKAHEADDRVTSVRLNPFKKADLGLDISGQIPWAKDGYYLNGRPVFTLDPHFHAGCYYVQEPGSMFLEHALNSVLGDISDFRVLDLCAAPGGKSTLLNSLLSEAGLLVSNEIIRNRVPALVHNLGKWGTANAIVTNNEPQAFGELHGYFDLLVIDAPCSGSGLFRKQPEAINEWSEENVQMCAVRQRDILSQALPSLKDEGWLFYSTCSYSIEENEDIVKWLSDEQGCELISIPVPAAWGIASTGYGYRFYPDQVRSEGFFCALLRKKGGSGLLKRSRNRLPPPSAKDSALINQFVAPGRNQLINLHGRLHLMGPACADFMDGSGNSLYLRKAGHFLGEVKGTDFVPSQELAWSLLLSGEVERLEVDKEKALVYLRKGNFQVSGDLKGLRLITYDGWGLGWGKFMPGRMNNYLPNELRILM